MKNVVHCEDPDPGFYSLVLEKKKKTYQMNTQGIRLDFVEPAEFGRLHIFWGCSLDGWQIQSIRLGSAWSSRSWMTSQVGQQ